VSERLDEFARAVATVRAGGRLELQVRPPQRLDAEVLKAGRAEVLAADAGQENSPSSKQPTSASTPQATRAPEKTCRQ